mmetsp:Transcript_26725/g.27770  ORF Transcript_26725/g.27770 Transcript_26725/m.27770 type:complete len:1347 (+) Transcript_26725:6-4046(+)
MKANTTNINDDKLSKYLDTNEDYTNIDVDLEGNYSLQEEKFTDTIDLADGSQLQRLKLEAQRKHPRKINNNEIEYYPICSTQTGCIGCGKEMNKSELDPYGLGIINFFKTIKAYCIIFFIIVIINIPLYIMYTRSHPEKPVITYQDAIFKTTIGNIAATLSNCLKIPVTDFSQSSIEVTLDCKSYTLSAINDFGTSPDQVTDINNNMQCIDFATQHNITISDTCTFNKNITDLVKDCVETEKSSCTIYINNTQQYLDQCTNEDLYRNFFLSYTCLDNNIPIGIWTITREEAAIMVVSIDGASIIIVMISILVIAISQKTNAQRYKMNTNQISDYSIHIENLELDNKVINKELDDLLVHLDSVLRIEVPNFKKYQLSYIYDINYPILTDTRLDLVLKKNKLNEIIIQKKRTIEVKKEKLSSKALEELNSGLDKLNEEYNKTMLELGKEDNNVDIVKDLWITYNKMKYSKHLLKAYTRYNKCDRFCIICCCQRKKIQPYYYKNKWLDLNGHIEEPSNIKWQNLTFNPCKRFFRFIVSIVFALILIVASFSVVVFQKYAQDQYVETYNTDMDCNFVPDHENYNEIVSQNKTIDDLELTLAKVNCYCKIKSEEVGLFEVNNFEIEQDGEIIYPCSEWFSLYLKYRSLQIGIILVIPLVNAIIVVMLTFVTYFERNHTLTDDLLSNMLKCFVTQFLNTAVVIVIVNLKVRSIHEWNPDFFVLAGIYDDFNGGWYASVGTTIAFTMFINIFTPHLSSWMFWMYFGCRRCCDSGCGESSRTNRLTKNSYFTLYVGPEFRMDSRYSQILTFIFVVLVFAPGIPILYACLLLFLFMTYWLDKILLLRFYKTPPQYDIFLNKTFNYIISIAIFLHLCFAIWIFGNPDIFADSHESLSFFSGISDTISNFSVFNDGIGDEIGRRATVSHNIFLLGLLGILVVFVVVRLIFYDLIKLICCCDTTEVSFEEEDLRIQKAICLTDVYKTYQLRKLLARKVYSESKNLEEQAFLKKYLMNSIVLDRYYIVDKLIQEVEAEVNEEELVVNYDENIKKYFQDKYYFNSTMKGDSSYNIAFKIEFEFYAMYHLIFSSNANKKLSTHFRFKNSEEDRSKKDQREKQKELDDRGSEGKGLKERRNKKDNQGRRGDDDDDNDNEGGEKESKRLKKNSEEMNQDSVIPVKESKDEEKINQAHIDDSKDKLMANFDQTGKDMKGTTLKKADVSPFNSEKENEELLQDRKVNKEKEEKDKMERITEKEEKEEKEKTDRSSKSDKSLNKKEKNKNSYSQKDKSIDNKEETSPAAFNNEQHEKDSHNEDVEKAALNNDKGDDLIHHSNINLDVDFSESLHGPGEVDKDKADL